MRNFRLMQGVVKPTWAADKVTFESLPKGGLATIRTLEAMAAFVRRDVADLELRAFVLELLKHRRGHDFTGEIETLFRFVRDSIRYIRDPLTVELVQDARRTIFYGQGDCDDKSTLLATLLGIAGHLPQFVVVGYSPNLQRFDHVYLEVYDKRKSKWISLDATNERAGVGWRVSGFNHQAKYPIFGRTWRTG